VSGIAAAALFMAMAVAFIIGVASWLRVRGVPPALKDRTPVTDAQFAALFDTPQESAVAGVVRQRLRRYLAYDTALVRPDDELARDLRLGERDGLDANEFLMEVEKAVGAKLPVEVTERVRTVRELVVALARLTK